MTDARPGILRRRRTLVAALLALCVGVVVWLAQSAPDEDYVAGLMSRVLRRPVELREFDIHIGRKIEFELGGLRVLESDEPGAEPIFQLRKARGRQSWPRLMAGQVLPREWAIDQPVLRITSDAGGGVPLPDIPEIDLLLTSGVVEWSLDGDERLALRDLHVRTWRGGLRRPTGGFVSARVLRKDVPVGRLALDFSGWIDSLEASGRLDELDLATLSMAGVTARGGGTADFELDRGGEETRLALDLVADADSLVLPGLKTALNPEETHLQIEARLRDDTIAVKVERAQLDDLIVSGSLDLHGGAAGRVRADLGIADFRPGARKRIHALKLMGLRFASWEGIGRRVRGGRVEGARIQLDLPRRGLARALSFGRKLDENELRISLRVRDGVFGMNSGSPIEGISGQAWIRGNVLEARQVRMRRTGYTLPEIDVRIDGMHRLVALPRAERGVPRGAGVPTPGLWPALSAIGGSGRGDGAVTHVRFSDLYLGYPPFILPLRDAKGTLLLSPGRVLVEGAEGVLGGAPAGLDVDFDTAGRRVEVDIRYLDSEVPSRASPPREWIDGQVQIESLYLGSWRIDLGEFRLRALGDRAELSDIQGTMGDGMLIGAGSISLAGANAAPYAFGLQLIHADASQLSGNIGLSEGSVGGTLFSNGRLAGALQPGKAFLESGDLKLVLRLENGTLGRLPASMALARLPSLSGVQGLLGQPLPYGEITTELKLESGTLEISTFKLTGPQLRILADGAIDLAQDEQPMDMVVALLFLQTVDRLLGSVPIVRDVVLGKDRNLVAAYFRLEGPRADPSARILPPEALQTATGVISGGMRRLRDLIGIGKPR